MARQLLVRDHCADTGIVAVADSTGCERSQASVAGIHFPFEDFRFFLQEPPPPLTLPPLTHHPTLSFPKHSTMTPHPHLLR